MNPEINIRAAKPAAERCDALVVFVPEKDSTSSTAFRELDKTLRKALSRLVDQEHYTGKTGEILSFQTHGKIRARKVILVGVGKVKEVNEEMYRRAAGASAVAARNSGCLHLAYTFPVESLLPEDRLAQAILEGALLGAYRFLKFKTKEEEIEPAKRIETITLLAKPGATLNSAVERARIYSEATNLARDLVNEPANTLNPEVLAETALRIGKENGLSVRVLEKAELEKLGAGAILGVGRGSSVPPRLIQISYDCGNKKAKKIALVGKGITFDSGGLSLKPSKSMEAMKSDMAGAAAVLCAMSVMPRIKPDCNVIGILCAAENMPSGKAIRPGDVLRAMNGKSIEIINTDAEGRLVLSDGLAWAVRQGADEIVDLATLTGACVIALGPYIAGVMGNDPDLIQRIMDAGRSAGESYWQLPVPNEYDFMIKSDIADIKNLAPNSEAGATQGALFLREFIGETKWAHLDIAGPSWYDKDFFYIPKNGTGFGVRTLLELLNR